MFRWLILSAFVLALVDLYLLYQVWEYWGGWAFLGVLFLPAFLGAPIAARQGRECLMQAQASMSQGGLPSQKVIEGGVMLVAGLLLIYPGPVTAALGILLLLPPIRWIVARLVIFRLKLSLAGMIANAVSSQGGVSGAGVNTPFGGGFVRVVRVGPGGPMGPDDMQGVQPNPTIKTVEAREVPPDEIDPDAPAANRLPGEKP